MTDNLSITRKQKSNPTTKLLYGVIGVLMIGIIGVSIFIAYNQLSQSNDSNDTGVNSGEADFDGTTTIDPPREMSDFTLTNQDGEPTSLSDFRGKFVLLTFGYTHCPDVCPLTLNEFRRIKESLDELGDDVAFVFISVDGQRDTPSAIQQYFETRKLDGFIGLTGEDSNLKELGEDYGLFFEIGENTSQGGYLVNHTAGSFLLDPDGRWVMRYRFGTLPSLIVDDLERYIGSY